MAQSDHRTAWQCVAAGALLALTALPSSVMAQTQERTGPYLQISLGALILQDNDYTGGGRSFTGSYDVGPYGGVTLGYRLSPNFRVEVELGAAVTEFTPSGGSSGDQFGAISGMIAGYLDVPVTTFAVPYIGLGIGAVGYTSRDLGGSGGFAAFGEAGVSIPLTAQLDLVPALRYSWMDAGSAYARADAGWLPKIGVRYAF